MFRLRFSALLTALALLLLAPCGSLAELRRGDRSEEVRQAQQMLFELGFLNGKADGVFGPKTEAAVLALQQYLDLEQTGVLDDETDFALLDLYFLATGVMAGDGPDPEEMRDLYPETCSWEGADEWGGVFCYRHQEERRLSDELERTGPAKLTRLLTRQLNALWERDILALYDEWIECVPEAEKHIPREQKQIFQDSLARYRRQWKRRKTDIALAEEMTWLQMNGIDLCFELHGMEPNTGE